MCVHACLCVCARIFDCYLFCPSVRICMLAAYPSKNNSCFCWNRLLERLAREKPQSVPAASDDQHPLDAYVGLRRFTSYWHNYIARLDPIVGRSGNISSCHLSFHWIDLFLCMVMLLCACKEFETSLIMDVDMLFTKYSYRGLNFLLLNCSSRKSCWEQHHLSGWRNFAQCPGSHRSSAGRLQSVGCWFNDVI